MILSIFILYFIPLVIGLAAWLWCDDEDDGTIIFLASFIPLLNIVVAFISICVAFLMFFEKFVPLWRWALKNKIRDLKEKHVTR